MKARSKYFVLTTDLLIPLGILAAAALSAFIVLYTPLFAIQQIDCQIDYQPCQNENLRIELDKNLGSNLLTFKESNLETRLLGGDFTLRAVEIKKELPQTLTVNLLSTYPVVALRLEEENSKWITLDQELRVIAVREQDPNVPTVTVEAVEPVQLGQKLDDSRLISSLELARTLSEELISVRTLKLVNDSTLILSFESGIEAYLTTQNDLNSQLVKLQSILADEKVVSTYQVIDVRFAQPILK